MTAGLETSGTLVRSAGLPVLLAAAVLFAAGQVSIDAVNGWWNDELFALWSSDTSQPFWSAFTERIKPDSNPPLYFSLLYGARLLFDDDRLAILALNVCFILAASAAVLLSSRRTGMAGAAVAAVAAFVLSGPVLAYAAEGRSYLAALAVAFCASWYAALAVCSPERRHSVWPFAVLGALGALTHVFAALFCGSLAAGLLALAVVDASRRDLVAPGLTLGLSASLVFAVWLLLAWSSLGNIGWIEFTLQAVREAVWYVRKLAVGGVLAVLLLAALLAFGFVRRATRPVVIVFGVAFALFALLPLIASLKQPLVMGRYWMIGAPGLIVLVVALAATWYREGWGPHGLSASRYALAGAAVLAVASSVTGFLAAREFTAAKPVWKGATVVGPLLQGCPAGSVHVGKARITTPAPTSPASFAYMTGTSPALFVDVGSPETPVLQASQARCPVLAWGEHVLLGHDFATRYSDADVLQLMKIEASPEDVEVRRHESGFVVLSRGARP